jgi:hypothetical protein
MLCCTKAKKLKIAERKQEILREKKLFVLDNSLRESTVGQLRGHTIENKWKIYEEVSAMLIFYNGIFRHEVFKSRSHFANHRRSLKSFNFNLFIQL